MTKEKNIPDQSQSQPGREHKMHPKPEIISEGYKGSNKLKDKIALITGGDSGIGRSVAVHFAREGAKVGIVYLEEDEDARTTRELVEAEGSQCLIIKGDLQDSEFCTKAVEKCVDEFGGLNILVNNAAMQKAKDNLENIDDEQLQQTFETNVFHYFRTTRAPLKYLREDDCVINTSSVTAYRGSDHLMDYASTKGAIVGFTRSLAKNLAKKKIRVNGVAPGPIWTPLIPATLDNVSEFGKDTPMGRPGQPSEVGPAYVFLASQDSSYITGQFIHINGGEIVGA